MKQELIGGNSENATVFLVKLSFSFLLFIDLEQRCSACIKSSYLVTKSTKATRYRQRTVEKDWIADDFLKQLHSIRISQNFLRKINLLFE